MRKLLDQFLDFYFAHALKAGFVYLTLFAVALFLTFQLHINSNQLDLLPDDMPQIQEARKINDMVGGTGYVILTLRHKQKDEGDRYTARAVKLKVQGHDEKSEVYFQKARDYEKERKEKYRTQSEKLKEAADLLYQEIEAMEDVRFVQHKFNLDFVSKKILYFWETEDLTEAFRRLSIKRNELIEKANPFYIDLGQKNYKLDLTDLTSKYTRIGKQQIVDEYLVSPDWKMMIMLIKPNFSMDDIQKSKELVERIKGRVSHLNLEEKEVDVGFTGAYVQFVDAYDSLHESLQPTMLLSLTGIAVILFLFIGRKRLIGSMLISLIYAIVLTFGLTYIVIGRLNIITAVFGGILAGLGIDFGIHFVFRFREEFSRSGNLEEAAKTAIRTTGSAAIYSAGTTAAAFGVLIFSDFQGFSEFGLISAYGIVITAIVMFFFTPLQLVILGRFFPGMFTYLKPTELEKKADSLEFDNWNWGMYARVVLPVILIIGLIGLYFARGVRFDDDYRNMLEADLPSEILKNEIQFRYEISGDPLGIATESLAEASSLWQYLTPMDENMSEMVAQVASIYSFVPPARQQLENHREIINFRRQSDMIKRPLLPAHLRPFWAQYQEVIHQRPFGIEQVPEYLKNQFRAVPSSKHEGWLTLIYPDTSRINTAGDVDRLFSLIGEIHYPIVGRGHIQRIAYDVPWWERVARKKIPGSRKKEKVGRMKLSPYEVNGALDLINEMDEEQFRKRYNFEPQIYDHIFKNRPFESIEDLQSEKWVARTTGSTILISRFIEVVRREARGLIIATALLISLIVLLSFRSLRAGFIALLPLVFGMAIILGLMPLIGLKLNYFNVVIFPIIIGYGLDNGIFMFHRYLENGSVSHAVYTTGKAIVASSLTTLAGWGSLSIAVHPGIQSMGFLAILGVLTMLILSITLIPAVLQLSSEGKFRMLIDVSGKIKRPLDTTGKGSNPEQG